jgi:hypothetical protein
LIKIINTELSKQDVEIHIGKYRWVSINMHRYSSTSIHVRIKLLLISWSTIFQTRTSKLKFVMC